LSHLFVVLRCIDREGTWPGRVTVFRLGTVQCTCTSLHSMRFIRFYLIAPHLV